MDCPVCGESNREARRFCADCGAALTLACPGCGFTNEPGERFCGGCGAGLTSGPAAAEPEGERKQVTVLFADLVGFTALSEGLDPETVGEIMGGCFDRLTREVERHEGRVNAFTGDGIMALFGAPIASEGHAASAVHAALGIQQAMQEYDATVRERWGVPFRMRIGLNTGLVIAGQVGDALRTDYTALGDTVNVAARLQAAAPSGAIWAGETTYRAAAAVFTWRAVTPVAVKGKAEPVPVYEVLGSGPSRSRFDSVAQRGLTRFVGRDAEVDQLLTAWQRARAGRGQVVSVVGEAGLGKSRLLHEFKQVLAAEGSAVFEGSCFAYGEATSYLPFLEITKALLGLDPAAGPAEAMALAEAHLARRSLDPAVLPYLGQLLGLPGGDDALAQLEAAVVRRRTVDAVKSIVVAEAGSQPLAVVVEDVHWIDKASEEVVSAVVEAMTGAPLLLVLVYRPEYLHAWSSKAYHAEIALGRLRSTSSAAMVRAILSKPFAASVTLPRLSVEQSQAMVQELLGTASLPAELEELIATHTDGNPLFIEELTRSLVESGELRRDGGSYVFTRPPERLTLPATVQDVLLARIDRLNPGLKLLLQVASVLGRVFSYPLLAAVAERDGTLDEALLQLEDLDFIYPAALAPEREYSFKHVLAQEAVYDTLVRSRRETVHERAGRSIEQLYPDRLEEFYERLAYHYGRSANADKAVEYLDLANQKATRANAMPEAKALFYEAMALLDKMPATPANERQRISLLANQFIVFFLMFELPEYFELTTRYETLAEKIEDTGLRGLFHKHVGHTLWLFGQIHEARPRLERAVANCEAAGNHSGAGMAHCLLEWCHWSLADYDALPPTLERALAALEKEFELRYFMWSHAAAGWSKAQRGRWREALAHCHEGMRVGEEYHDDSVVCFSAYMLSIAHNGQGDIAGALQAAELAVAKAPTPADEVWADTFLAKVWSRTGQADRAVEALEKLLPLYTATRMVIGEVFTAVYLGEAYLRAGRPPEARAALEAVAEHAERIGMRYYFGWALRLLGEVARQDASPEGRELASRYFEQSIEVLDAIGAENDLALAYAGYGELCQDQAEPDKAQAYLQQALEIFERLGTASEPDRVRALLEQLRRHG